jgi:two-component system copper resistance phosphate regulon response regulator CusR
MKVLLAEDNTRLVDTLVQGLAEESIDVAAAVRGSEAIAGALRGDIDVVVLDLGLPDMDGLDVLRAVRDAGSHVPILVLTARDAVESRVAALGLGADDYLVKPFAFEELLARLRAIARRASGPRWSPLTAGAVAITADLGVTIDGRRIALSPREHAVLGYLLRRRGEVVTRAAILAEVFGYDFDPGTNVIDVHIAHLRRKLAGAPLRIETIRGAGFRLDVDGAAP